MLHELGYPSRRLLWSDASLVFSGCAFALAVYGALATERLEQWMRAQENWWKLGTRFWQPAVLLLCVINCLAMMYRVPLVLKEAIVNSTTRVALEKQLADVEASESA